MEISHICFIVNPSAGKEEPILEKIGQVFQDSGLRLTIHVLEKEEDPAEIVRQVARGADLLAVYGGDGSITEAASALIGTVLPLAIVPGGTANVLSKDLGIPQNTEEALRLIRDGKYQLKTIDTGLVNGCPFLLRVNLGIMAGMITGTDPELKDMIGQLAYGISAMESIRDAELINYRLNIDGEKVEAAGVSLTVTNSGSMGIGGLQLQSGISISDGLLDVLLLRDASLLSIIKAAGGSLFGLETDAVSHWVCKTISVALPGEQCYLCDDREYKGSELTIQIVPSSLIVAVPLTE